MPQLWIVAGPNGSGKTTLVRSGVLQRHIGPDTRHINPDDITAELRRLDPATAQDALNLRAAQMSDAELDQCIASGHSVLVETVLSSDKFKPRVAAARAAGFTIGLTFVVLADPALSVDRVAQRVALGGHDVPQERIRARWYRAVANMPWFADHADIVQVIDNSQIANPVLIAEKAEGRWTIPRLERFLSYFASVPG